MKLKLDRPELSGGVRAPLLGTLEDFPIHRNPMVILHQVVDSPLETPFWTVKMLEDESKAVYEDFA